MDARNNTNSQTENATVRCEYDAPNEQIPAYRDGKNFDSWDRKTLVRAIEEVFAGKWPGMQLFVEITDITSNYTIVIDEERLWVEGLICRIDRSKVVAFMTDDGTILIRPRGYVIDCALVINTMCDIVQVNIVSE